jgi:DNA polymerase IV
MKGNIQSLNPRTKARVLFIDMNSFFASCEQQDNYWLRNRPVAVCVYTGKYGCVIAPSIEAKRFGVKTGMRLNEAMALCKELVPIETHPNRYRHYHTKIIAVLKSYCEDVYPKSIDEAVVDLTNYELIYKDVTELAKKIKLDIQNKVGDWLKCSIGIAPNSFLAKLASDMQKPNGLTIINQENIDEQLAKLKLTDLPGIANNMEIRLNKGGIQTPLQMRYTSSENLKSILKSIVGYHWYCRLNFIEIDLNNEHDYKSMQAMRHLSKEIRQSTEQINELIITLCLTLEKRMTTRHIFAQVIGFHVSYANGERWDDHLNLKTPLQDGADLYVIFSDRMTEFEKLNPGEKIIHSGVIRVMVYVSNFIHSSYVQYNLFENNQKKDSLRKLVYELKHKYGNKKMMRGIEAGDEDILQDVIGFGSVKDLHDEHETH